MAERGIRVVSFPDQFIPRFVDYEEKLTLLNICVFNHVTLY